MDTTAENFQTRAFTLTKHSLLGLAAGLVTGLLAHESQLPALLRLSAFVEPLGIVWVNALSMIVLPLIVSLLVVAIAQPAPLRQAGRAGGLSLLLFLILLGVCGLGTVLVTPWLIELTAIDAGSLVGLNPEVTADTLTVAAGATDGPALAEWLKNLIPSNVFGAAAAGEILPIVIATMLFALAVSRAKLESRRVLVGFFQAIADTAMLLLRWLLVVIPIAVFAIALPLSAQVGVAAAGTVIAFVVLVSALLLVATAGLYPVAVLGGRLGLRRFAAAVIPAQAVAIGSRSSIASLPPMLDGATRQLGVPNTTAEFVLPLAVSTFKLSRAVSSPFKLLFLAYLYGIPLAPGYVAVFLVTVMILSFGSPGIPSGGTFVTLPFYLGAGIPLEGVVLLKAVDAVPDIFKTLLNVTADVTVTTVVARFAPLGAVPVVARTPTASSTTSSG